MSNSSTRGAPSISQRPYMVWIPRLFIDWIVLTSAGSCGGISSTSTAACKEYQQFGHRYVAAVHTAFLLSGPSSV